MSENQKCGRMRYVFPLGGDIDIKIQRIFVRYPITDINREPQKDENDNHVVIGVTIGILVLITVLIAMAVRKYKTSTPNNSQTPSLNSSRSDEMEMHKLGPFKCKRRIDES